MSIHSSLRGTNNLVGERSVLSRMERLQKLQKDGKFDPKKRSVFGLPKVRTKFKVAGAKKAEKPKPADGAATAPAAAAPAAPAAPAAKGKAAAAPAKGAKK